MAAIMTSQYAAGISIVLCKMSICVNTETVALGAQPILRSCWASLAGMVRHGCFAHNPQVIRFSTQHVGMAGSGRPQAALIPLFVPGPRRSPSMSLRESSMSDGPIETALFYCDNENCLVVTAFIVRRTPRCLSVGVNAGPRNPRIPKPT